MSNEYISKQIVEDSINKAIYWMKEYVKEWESYSESSVDAPAAKAEAMHIALDLVDKYVLPLCSSERIHTCSDVIQKIVSEVRKQAPGYYSADGSQYSENAAFNSALNLVQSKLNSALENERQGIWLKVLYDEPWEPGQFGRCSLCRTINDASVRRMPKFCPECGAGMKGGDVV